MTGEEFRARYHLLDRVTEGDVETFHAQAPNGAMMMVHFLRGGAVQAQRVASDIAALRPELQRKIVRTVEVEGSTAVLTRFILDLDTFEEWLRNGRDPAHAAPPPAEEASPLPATPPPPPPLPPAPPTPPRDAPGEFTRMFTAQPAGPVPTQAQLSPVSQPAPETLNPPEPGEFTRMFQATTPPAPPPASAIAATPLAPPPPLPPPPPAEATPVRGTTSDDYLQRLASAHPATPAATPPPAPLPPPPMAPFGVPDTGPSEYTRVLASAHVPSPAPAPAAAPAAAPQAAPAPKTSLPRWLVIGTFLLATAVLALIITAIVLGRSST